MGYLIYVNDTLVYVFYRSVHFTNFNLIFFFKKKEFEGKVKIKIELKINELGLFIS